MFNLGLISKLIAALAVMAILVALYFGIRHFGYTAGEDAVYAKWAAAEMAREADYRDREAALRRQAVTLSFDLEKQRDTAASLRQELDDAKRKGSLVVEVPGKCPELGPGFVGVWNDTARGTPAGATSTGGSPDTVPGAGTDPAR